ncbi:hypothetical protein ABPG77_002538 [Micractinium sp. CCAP 211/92]
MYFRALLGCALPARYLTAHRAPAPFAAAGQAMPPMYETGDGQLPHDELKGDWESVADLLDSKNGTSLLWTAIQAAAEELGPLVDALSSNATVATLFAPTDEAFTALGEATLQTLLDDPAKLAEILKYHVIVGEALTLADIEADSGSITQTALDGTTGEVEFRKAGKKAQIKTTSGQSVPIYQYNIKAGSAVVHTVKDVLIPGNMTLGAMAPAPM